MTTDTGARQARIQVLNDTLRTNFTGGRVLLTSGVEAAGDANKAAVLRAVRCFAAFNPGNDPYGEHDFGRVEVASVGYFWKIDYFDADGLNQSPDPSDETVTARVMTIMREDEY